MAINQQSASSFQVSSQFCLIAARRLDGSHEYATQFFVFCDKAI
jgi:hypothetical protein